MVLNVGLIGFGTVGTGAIKTLRTNADLIARRCGAEIHITGIADVDWNKDRGIDLTGIRCRRDGWELIHDPQIQVIVELIGGTTVAKTFVLGALQNGKDVVTANKALLANYGKELFKTAQDQGRKIYFEGSVGGGIPVIQSLYGGLASAQVTEIYGIINGTSNYILTAMEERELSFQEVLQEAQSLGYAELDPTYDIEGIDAAHKLTILASLAFHSAIPFPQVHTEGIQEITIEDIRFGRKLGYCLKLLAIAKDLGNEIEVRVHPTFIPETQLMASVHSVFNAIQTYAPGLGSTLLYGRGAGDLPTGHAVVSDLMQCAQDHLARRSIQYENFFTSAKTVRAMSEVITEYYLRFIVKDRPGVLAKIAGLLGEHDISIHFVLQTEPAKNDICPLVIMTHEAQEGNLLHALDHIKELSEVIAPAKVIRIEPMNSHKE